MSDRRLQTFLRENLASIAILFAALAVALFFAARLAFQVIYFSNPANIDVDLKPWMTPRFVVMTYDLPRPIVLEILEIDPDRDPRMRLRRIAERQGLTMDELTEKVREAASVYRASGQ